jgi:hypothetical protein
LYIDSHYMAEVARVGVAQVLEFHIAISLFRASFVH